MTQMGMPIALALLEGPTKAVVASAFTAAGLGSTLLGFSPNTALCLTYRQAYDDDVFKVRARRYISSKSSISLYLSAIT